MDDVNRTVTIVCMRASFLPFYGWVAKLTHRVMVVNALLDGEYGDTIRSRDELPFLICANPNQRAGFHRPKGAFRLRNRASAKDDIDFVGTVFRVIVLRVIRAIWIDFNHIQFPGREVQAL